jgi:protein gp37
VAETSIEWTDRSINPIRFGRGHYCQKISPGCANCYASRYQPRVGNPQFGGTGSALPMLADFPSGPKGEPDDGTFADLRADRLWFDESKLLEVLRRKKPTKWFWCDMTDLFGSWVPDEWIDRCFATMEQTPQHTHQVLTKRAGRMQAYLSWRWGKREDSPGFRIPARNIWCGVSVEDQQRADERIPHLLKTPAAVRFLSVEPLLGELNLKPFAPFFFEKVTLAEQRMVRGAFPHGIPANSLNARISEQRLHWVIVGGESGPGARCCDVEWVRSIRDQCRAAGVACFVKQLGSKPIDDRYFAEASAAFEREWGFPPGLPNQIEECTFRPSDRKGGDPAEWADDLRVREFPEVAKT